MSKFFLMGNFTQQGFSGLVKDPKSDRGTTPVKKIESINNLTKFMKSYSRYNKKNYTF